MSANIRELGAWRIHLIWCTWRFLKYNKELAPTIYIWTGDMCSGLFPGTPRTASSAAEHHFLQACLQTHPAQLCVTLLPCFPDILLNFVLYLPLYTSLYIPNFTLSNMEPTGRQVRNHYSQKNQEAQLGRALARAVQKTANLRCWSNVWTSNPAFEYSVRDS